MKAPVRGAGGAVVGTVGIARDVSERVRAEEERAQLEARLARTQRLESVGRLAGGVAHDFNNMLTVILGCVDGLRSGLPGDSPLLAEVADLEQAGLRSREIIRQLLAFSRRQPVAPRPVDLDALVGGARATLSRLVGEDVEVELELGSSPWKVRIDPAQLDQLLVNLAANARDAMPDGGRLRISTAPHQVRARRRAGGG